MANAFAGTKCGIYAESILGLSALPETPVPGPLPPIRDCAPLPIDSDLPSCGEINTSTLPIFCEWPPERRGNNLLFRGVQLVSTRCGLVPHQVGTVFVNVCCGSSSSSTSSSSSMGGGGGGGGDGEDPSDGNHPGTLNTPSEYPFCITVLGECAPGPDPPSGGAGVLSGVILYVAGVGSVTLGPDGHFCGFLPTDGDYVYTLKPPFIRYQTLTGIVHSGDDIHRILPPSDGYICVPCSYLPVKKKLKLTIPNGTVIPIDYDTHHWRGCAPSGSGKLSQRGDVPIPPGPCGPFSVFDHQDVVEDGEILAVWAFSGCAVDVTWGVRNSTVYTDNKEERTKLGSNKGLDTFGSPVTYSCFDLLEWCDNVGNSDPISPTNPVKLLVDVAGLSSIVNGYGPSGGGSGLEVMSANPFVWTKGGIGVSYLEQITACPGTAPGFVPVYYCGPGSVTVSE